jgi:O-methyltransferase domain/Dimerisation domain
MADETASTTSTPPAPAVLLQMMTGYWVSQAVYIAAKLGLADLLVDGPRSAEELAAASHSHAPSLYRLLRALASVGVFTEASPGAFALTPLAALLRSGTPDSMRALAITYNEEMYRAWAEMLHSVQTGETAFDHQFGMPVFQYFAAHPEADRVFNEAMTGYTSQLASAVPEVYDFTMFGTVVDVGGSYGTLLAAILRRHPTMQGILFDQPRVVADAEQHLAAAGIADRCRAVGGDFFTAVPAGGDAYILSQILHDWDDTRCLTILQQCRQVMPEHGKLLVVELVVPPGNEPSFGKWLDLHMLAIPGGRERTAGEYDALFRAAGFALGRVVPTPAGPSVVEATPA